MTLTQLRHFVVLAEEGSFVRASARLYLTQPALTRSIRALEDGLGAPLFDRLGRRIDLTPFGQVVLDRARHILGDAEALKHLGRSMQAGLVGQLRVGLSSAPGALFSTVLLGYMSSQHPRLQVQIARGNTAVLLEALRQQVLDAAIVDIRAMRPTAELAVDVVFELEAGFLVRPGHPLLQQAGAIDLPQVLHYPIASTPLSDEVARLLMARYGPLANPDDMVTLRSDETITLVELARHSEVVLLTVRAVAPDLVPLPIDPPLQATGRFGLVTLARRQAAPALPILREQLIQWIQQLPGLAGSSAGRVR